MLRRLSAHDRLPPLFFQKSQIRSIYGSMIQKKLQKFTEELQPLGETLTLATIELYEAVRGAFLPTPSKIHYLFNLRDISKVRRKLLSLFILKFWHLTWAELSFCLCWGGSFRCFRVC